ncbi:unnamed protein product [Phytophthora lilii]|uniref:Unnamed protein product n=1 Tax=Phytophthora lilii TaxID=2077276 RepID=A0A9W6WS33_9STRA|nr:unnamed protein product [Phytophthora lilii]
MAGTEEAHEPLSLAQVEEELRSAEAYLTASQGAPPAPIDAASVAFKAEIGTFNTNELSPRNDLGMERERRREILAKLSVERQAALRARYVSDGREETPREDAAGELFQHTERSDMMLDERSYRTPEERHKLIQKLLNHRSMHMKQGAADMQDLNFSTSPVHHDDNVETGDGSIREYQHKLDGYSGLPSTESDDDDEIYYASDILDNDTGADIQPRSRMDFIYEGEESHQFSSPDFPVSAAMETPMLERNEDLGHESVSNSLFAKLLGQDTKVFASDEAALKPDEQLVNKLWEAEDDSYEHTATSKSADKSQVAMTKPLNRIDILAQPRNHTFAEREKQRLLLEMEELRECTFHPNVLKPAQSAAKPRASDNGNSNGRPGTTDFQWLTLSPRQKIFKRPEDSNSKKGVNENGSQHVIQRLHLDGTARYDSRERAREALEAQQLQECTFKPKINPTSKSMFSMVDYKPIHHRVSDLQRAKRIREQLDIKECGPLSFTPSINPKSREIATNKLAEREADAFIQARAGRLTSQKVTDRLADDADAAAERRLATQEYFDMLNEQPFAPKISDTSRKIVEQKPEFKMDFVARQEYFQLRDQEKLEALEGLCEMDYTRGERLTFKPDIGNAEGVLKHLRPDRCTESSQQKLYRLTYNDQREAELKKQLLREEKFAQYSFKPEINPVSKALGRTSTLDELSHPVRDIQEDPPMSKRSSPQERRSGNNAPASRVALRKYFAHKRFRSRVALEMEEASKAECTFQPNLVASTMRNGSSSTNKLYNREPRSRTKLEWQSENLLHLIEAERQKKADEIEAKRNAQELKELEECTFRPNLQKPRRRSKSAAKGSPSPPRDVAVEEVNMVLCLRNGICTGF